jgi:hypothetical protein
MRTEDLGNLLWVSLHYETVQVSLTLSLDRSEKHLMRGKSSIFNLD